MGTLRRKRDTIKKQLWQIEFTDRYYYSNSRNGYRWVETTFWFDPETMERKETTRDFQSYDLQDYKKPEWAKSITEYRSSLNYY